MTNRTCRYCGHQSSSRYCSGCGLQLGSAPLSLGRFVASRGLILVLAVGRFIWTSLLLVFRPTALLLTLNQHGTTTCDLRLFRSTLGSTHFSEWRRCTTAANFLVVTIVFLSTLSVVQDDLMNPIRDYFRDWVPSSTGYLVEGVAGNLILEGAVTCALLLYWVPYRWILGVDRRGSAAFTEFFLYSAGQFLLFSTLGLFIVEPLAVEEPVWAVFLAGTLILMLSVYYFLLLPLGLSRNLFGVTQSRVVLAYTAMLMFSAVWTAAFVGASIRAAESLANLDF